MNNTHNVLPTTYWLNTERIDEAKCCHHLAIGTEPREFKGIELTPVTPVVAAAPALHHALLTIADALNTYEAPPEIIELVNGVLTQIEGDVIE